MQHQATPNNPNQYYTHVRLSAFHPNSPWMSLPIVPQKHPSWHRPVSWSDLAADACALCQFLGRLPVWPVGCHRQNMDSVPLEPGSSSSSRHCLPATLHQILATRQKALLSVQLELRRYLHWQILSGQLHLSTSGFPYKCPYSEGFPMLGIFHGSFAESLRAVDWSTSSKVALCL